jgi:acyl-CoA reductase-like NAD-dependent aldehyde dehydrogenase
VAPLHEPRRFSANIPLCTRKDLRNAVEAAAKAGAGWAKRTPYNRAQILYRLAEMLEARAAEMAAALALHGTARRRPPRRSAPPSTGSSTSPAGPTNTSRSSAA